MVPAELVAYLDSLTEPHILFDTNYRIVAANRAYRQQFGMDQQVVGRTCYEVSHRFSVPCDQAGESCPLARARVSGHRERVLHLHHTPQGQAYVNIELVPLTDDQGRQQYFIEKMEALDEAHHQSRPHGLIGRSEPFRQMLALLMRVAPSSASVLLLGETGTGKELVAQAVHSASKRATKAFVPVDCSSLTETLFESELFGHEKGAFTGALQSKPGLAEVADGGTLFLDEVGDIPLPMQVKLLRLLESGTYRRVGSTDLRRTDVRVIAATHRDLYRMVEAGEFREDLLHRISTFPVRLPPLRERADDIPVLVEALLKRVAPGRRLSLSARGLMLLSRQPFKGNVRELRNLLERIALLSDSDVADIEVVQSALELNLTVNQGSQSFRYACFSQRGSESGQEKPPPRLKDRDLKSPAARQWKMDQLRRRVLSFHGSRADLAAELGMSERTLYRKLKDLDLT